MARAHANPAICGLRLRPLWGHKTWGVAEVDVACACGRWRWGLRWSSLRGHETCEGRVEVGVVADACGRRHWGLRWSSLRGHETCE
eukprot:5424178-Pyramimonas_sp.AAC.1